MSTSKKQKAGKASGIRRAASAKQRQLAVLSAYNRLKPPYKGQPYSDRSLVELENELRRSEQRRSIPTALEKTLDPPLSDNESIVEIIGDPARVLRAFRAERGRKEISLEEYGAKLDGHVRRLTPEEREAEHLYEALLSEVTGGLLADNSEKKKRRSWSRDRLIKDLEALGIKSKRRKKRSR